MQNPDFWHTIETLFQSGNINIAVSVLESEEAKLSPSPELPRMWARLGALYRTKNDFDEAISAFKKALSLLPSPHPQLPSDLLITIASLYNELGWVLRKKVRLTESLECFNTALSIAPHFHGARANRSLILLQLGDYLQGFAEYEARLLDAPSLIPQLPLPFWRGEPLKGISLLVLGEQGFGDQIQFARFIPRLAEMGAEVDVLTPSPLVALFQRLQGVRQAFTSNDHGEYHYQVPLLSLPHILGVKVDNIAEKSAPATIPYFLLDTRMGGRVDFWRSRINRAIAEYHLRHHIHATTPIKKVGLVWAGGHRPSDAEATAIDARRNLTLKALSPLLSLPNIQWFSLQQQVARHELSPYLSAFSILDWGEELQNFADTAALLSGLDLLITCDTAIAHLAGAIGLPVWILSRHDACWRWMQDPASPDYPRKTTPWYPTATLFQQRKPNDWEGVIAEVQTKLMAREGKIGRMGEA